MNGVLQGIRAVTVALVIFIIVKIRQFLEEMPDCGCQSPSFKRIRFLELLVIGLVVVSFFFEPILADKKDIGGVFKQTNTWYYKLMLPVAILIYFYLVYNAVQFSDDVNKDDTCKKCGDKWTKYALYGQTMIYGLSAAIIVIGGAVFVNMGLVNISTGFGMAVVTGILFILGLIATTVFGGSVNDLLDKVMELSGQREGFCGCSGNKDSKKIFE
jgi:hypothetical protein